MCDEATGVLENELKVNPQCIMAMVSLGRAYDQLNQSVKTVAIFEEAVKFSPENLRAHRTLTKIYAAQGVKEAALQSCRLCLPSIIKIKKFWGCVPNFSHPLLGIPRHH